jgi:putative PIN family toxin of toxin-antitoxin system
VLDICWESAPAIVAVSSEFIFNEFAEHAQSKFGVPVDTLREAVTKLRAHAEIVNPSDIAPDACRDSDDLPILGTAVAGHADYLVTGDQDLLALKSYLGIAIVSPREFYDLIREQG